MNKQGQDTRGHILTVGRRLTAQQGYTGVGLSELLKQAGVPKGSFYHYFPSKEAYGCAVLEDFIREYKERLRTSLYNPQLNSRDKFLTYFRDWSCKQLSNNPEDRCLVVKLSAEVADLSEDMSRILRNGVTDIVARLAETLEQGIADGSIGALEKPAATAATIYHMWLGASLVASLSRSDAALEAAMKSTEALVPAP